MVLSSMLHLLLVGAPTIFWLHHAQAQSSATAVEVRTKYAAMKIPATSPLLALISLSNECFDSAADLWSEFVQPGDVAFDINSGYGSSFFPLAKLVGETGNVIGFEPDDDDFELLYTFMTEDSVLSQYCALVKAALFERVISVKDFADDAHMSHMSLATIFKLYGPSCPKIIRINEVASRPMSTLMILLGDRAVLMQCRPIIYLDNNFLEYSAAIIKVLEELDYAMYWHTSWAIDPVTYEHLNRKSQPGQSLPANKYSTNLLGIPMEKMTIEGASSNSYDGLQQRHKLVPYSNTKYYICEVRGSGAQR